MIKLQVADLNVNILYNDSQNSSERNLELLVDYVDALNEIYDSLNNKDCAKN